MKEINSKCLVLNADYMPLAIISWQKAILWSFKNDNNYGINVDIIDFYKDDYIMGTNGKKHPIPAIVKTQKYFRIHHSRIKFSRKNLFIRDNYSCQYCGLKFEPNKLTYDHVIPKSIWINPNRSPTNWTNIVTACVKCNLKKGNRTPQQANMPLKNLPIMPEKTLKYLPISYAVSKIKNDIPREWTPYLPESYYL